MSVVNSYIKVFSELCPDDSEFLSQTGEVKTLVNFLWEEKPLKDFLCSPAVEKGWREKIIRKALEDAKVSDLVIKLFVIMIRKGRASHLKEFATSLQAHADERCGILRGTIESAVNLDKKVEESLIKMISQHSSKKAELEFKVNENLIGGVRVKTNYMVLDTSINKKLIDAKHKLLRKRA